ncbi:hypothetical protein HYV98_01135 [Candidatus Azambacteria bacterium]|nr:hypothetical protein [Candidatus Azambacteria bacterium]
MKVLVVQREGRDLAAILKEVGIDALSSCNPLSVLTAPHADLVLMDQSALARELLEGFLNHGTPHPRPHIWIVSPETSAEELRALVRTKMQFQRVRA